MLTSNTGKSDPKSVWGALGDLVENGFGVYNTVTGKSKNAPAAQAPTPPAPAPDAGWKQYLPWVIGGVVLLVIVGFVIRK